MLNSPIFKDFKKAVDNLKEVLDLKKTEIIRDSAIKRFELCFDLAWKCVKNYAKSQGIECYSPKECLKTAFQLKLIDYEEKWLQVIEDRNLTVHLYKKEQAEQVYSKLPEHLKLFQGLLNTLK